MVRHVGYRFLMESLDLRVLPPAQTAEIRPVTRIEAQDGVLAVPASAAPAGDDPLDHLLFALRREGTDLALAAACMPSIDEARVVAALKQTPTGQFVRKAAYLWEWFNQRTIEGAPSGTGVPVPLFDADRYVTGGVTGPGNRWRVQFNGLGTRDYCPIVRRTPKLVALMQEDVMTQVRGFMSTMNEGMLDRAISWAYLDETTSTYALERETPSGKSTQTTIEWLKRAHDRTPLSEAFLVQLQNAIITNPFLKAVEFRNVQNHLGNGAPGALGVTYVPPRPQDLMPIMDGVMCLSRLSHQPSMDALLRAALVSFGFVFAHPFMDGNGRLSRFLLHHTFCTTGAIGDDQILPMSTAMKRHEKRYLDTLKSFSKPARALWSVMQIDAGVFDLKFEAADAVYRYWDATACVEFTHDMAKEALTHDLEHEVRFLEGYDKVVKRIDAAFDVVASDLTLLISLCYQAQGRLSNHRRKQYQYKVPKETLDAIEIAVREEFGFAPAA